MKLLLPLALVLVSASAWSKRPELPGSSRGSEAIRKHADQLEKIAAKYGQSKKDFEKHLLSDESLGLDKDGKLYVSEEELLPNYVGDSEANLNPDAAKIPDDMALRLHSRAGASKTILLDFTGHLVEGTSWNWNGPINALPFDVDGNPNAFSADELHRIKAIWLQVAEDYAPFNVDVTTEDTGTLNGVRIILTPTSDWYGAAGGVAFVGSFSWNDNTPAWVFSSLLGNNSKYVAEAASHEAGHTLGLNHQSSYDSNGTKTADYNPGFGSGDTGWAPIMGVGYYKKNTRWHDGPMAAGPTYLQDDVAIISSRLPFIADDAPQIISSSSFKNVKFVADAYAQTFKHQGTISSRGEIDVMRIYAGSGPLDIQVSGPVTATNLDIRVRLHSSSGVIMADVNPPGSGNVSLSFPSIPEGIYSLEIIPSNYTDPLSGALVYSDYGVMGRYYISGSSALYPLTIPSDAQPNQAPSVNAGLDKTVTLPTSSVTLTGQASDNDGSIASVQWSKVSGPSAVISSSQSLSTSVTGLVAGTYIFRLTVVDNMGLSRSDDVSVIVQSSTTCTKKCGGGGGGGKPSR